MENQTPATFPLIKSFVEGLRLLAGHRTLLLKLSVLPFMVTLVTLVVLRLLGDTLTLFWLPVAQIPSNVVIGIECAVLLRFLVLKELPLSLRSPDITHAALGYTAITYLMTGAYAALLYLHKAINAAPETAGPYLPFAIALMVFVFWAARWMWLNVPLALDWPVADFFKRLGRWSGSFRIFALFGLCSISLNYIVALLRTLIHVAVSSISKGLASAFDDALVAGGTVLLAVVFTCTTAQALKYFMKDKPA